MFAFLVQSYICFHHRSNCLCSRLCQLHLMRYSARIGFEAYYSRSTNYFSLSLLSFNVIRSSIIQASWYCPFTCKCTQTPKINNFTVSLSTKCCTKLIKWAFLCTHRPIEIGEHQIYRAMEIHNPGNIGQFVEHMGVCASISAK